MNSLISSAEDAADCVAKVTSVVLDVTVSIGPSLCSVTDRMECERSGNEMLV